MIWPRRGETGTVRLNLLEAGRADFATSSNDKTLPISLHETWPGVPGPSCLGPWTGNQEPKALSDSRAASTSCLVLL